MKTIESKIERKNKSKRAIVIRHRRNKNLCERCGMDIHEGDCIEIYTKADMRTIHKSTITLDLKKKKDTIISYRRKKLLCIRCGKEKHNGQCLEDYNKSDNRTESEIRDRPAIIPTPKDKGPSILEEMEVKKIISVELIPNESITLHRDFIVVNLENSNNDNRIEFSCINQLSKKFKDYIICLIGNVEKNFPYSDVMKLKTLTNIRYIKTTDEQIIVNYIASSKKLFTFPNIIYTPICIKYNIPLFEFLDGKNATNFLPSEAYEL